MTSPVTSEASSVPHQADMQGIDHGGVPALTRCYHIPDNTHPAHLLISQSGPDSLNFKFHPDNQEAYQHRGGAPPSSNFTSADSDTKASVVGDEGVEDEQSLSESNSRTLVTGRSLAAAASEKFANQEMLEPKFPHQVALPSGRFVVSAYPHVHQSVSPVYHSESNDFALDQDMSTGASEGMLSTERFGQLEDINLISTKVKTEASLEYDEGSVEHEQNDFDYVISLNENETQGDTDSADETERCETHSSRQKENKKESKKNVETIVTSFTPEKLYTFIVEEISESEFTCRNCKMVFSNKEDAKSHVNIHSPYRCISCDITFSTIGDMLVHYRVEHEEIYHCTYCLYSTKRKGDFKRHIKSVHRQIRSYLYAQEVCFMCGLCFSAGELMDEHLNKEHGIEKTLQEGDFQCPLCNVILRSDCAFRSHIKKHQGNYIQCRYANCEYKHVAANKMKKHYESVHGGIRDFACPFEGCEARFINRTIVKEHLNVVHHKIRKFFCETCGKGFLAKKHLSVHERIHSDSKPIGCKFCDYRCRQAASLKWHMKQSHPEELDSAKAASTTEDPKTKNTLKRGRKAKRTKTVSAASKSLSNEGSAQANVSKRKRSSSDSNSYKDGSCSLYSHGGGSDNRTELETLVCTERQEGTMAGSSDDKTFQKVASGRKSARKMRNPQKVWTTANNPKGEENNYNGQSE